VVLVPPLQQWATGGQLPLLLVLVGVVASQQQQAAAAPCSG
jgi:hypothetical protein